MHRVESAGARWRIWAMRWRPIARRYYRHERRPASNTQPVGRCRQRRSALGSHSSANRHKRHSTCPTLIGIGGRLAAPPLPHHRAYGHCRQRYEHNLRRVHASRFVSTRGVWQKPK
jgi:hypothetical protein